MRGYKNFESDPHPGDLRHLVEIGYTENRINENGYPEETDIVLCKVWSAVTDAGNQHYRSADVMNTEAVVNFTIRYRLTLHCRMTKNLRYLLAHLLREFQKDNTNRTVSAFLDINGFE